MSPNTLLPLADLLPLKILVVSLQFTEPARPRFFHQAAINGFVRYLLDQPKNFAEHLIIDTPESGRVQYAAGEYYRFNVIALAGSDALLSLLIERLRGLPHSAVHSDLPLAFRNNWRLLALHDAFSEQEIRHVGQLSEYSSEVLEEEAAQWAQCRELFWHWLSPARLLKAKGPARDKLKGEARFCRNAGEVDGELLLSRLFDAMADLLRRRGASPPPRPKPPLIHLQQTHVFWLDSEYSNKAGGEKVMGGLLGYFAWRIPDTFQAPWWPLLVLGQYLGVGQRRHFGWGRYELVTADGGVSYRRGLPASPLVTKVVDEDNLLEAYRHIQRNAASPQRDASEADEDDESESFAGEEFWPEDEADEDDSFVLERLQHLAAKLETGRYEPPVLKGYLLQQGSDLKNKERALAVPPFWDRVLQRAVSQVLSPALEEIMYGRSHGYRPGRSRITAKEAIQKAWREGYTWVFESDIEDFFPSVNRSKLAERLRALFYDDALVDCIMAWLAAPVEFEGKTLPRSGLPLGSPLSPLMANLMLDDFDSDMQSAGFRLIRYADDFVVMCKSPDEAERAADAAQASLAEHGLDLKAEKTRIRKTEQGFKYLGYLFVNDMALDVGGSQTDIGLHLSNQRWLERLGQRPHKHISDAKDLPKNTIKASKDDQQLRIGELEKHGTFLCISGKNAFISTQNGRLVAERDDETLVDVPWQQLQAVLLAGPHHITTPALRTAMANGVPVHFASGQGYYQGVAWQGQPTGAGYHLWVEQQARAQAPEAALYVAQQLVAARVEQQAETLRLRGLANQELKSRAKRVKHCENLAELNGVEGQAAKIYFKTLKEFMPEVWGFSHRARRPPPDPFNVLLSLGYSVLYAYTDSILRVDGLLPWQGFYHQSHGRHAALASDFMEPFRHQIERLALSQVTKRILKPEDFSQDERGGCHMEYTAKRRYLAQLQQRFASATAIRGSEEKQNLYQQLHQQNLSFIAWLRGEKPFEAWSQR